MKEISILKEREVQLTAEAALLREQNDLMEFRIVELEECQGEVKYFTFDIDRLIDR